MRNAKTDEQTEQTGNLNVIHRHDTTFLQSPKHLYCPPSRAHHPPLMRGLCCILPGVPIDIELTETPRLLAAAAVSFGLGESGLRYSTLSTLT
jgi:hypothetical protein